MKSTSTWPARLALTASLAAATAALLLISAGGVAALGLPTVFATTGSPGPTPSTSCIASIPPGVPTPPPICQTVTPSPEPEPSASPSGSPSKKPGKKGGQKDPGLTIVWREKAALFTGLVDSIGKCEDLRRVVVYKVQKGKDKVVGKDITDSNARYEVPMKRALGSYYAKAPASVSIGYATQVDCEALRSEPTTIARAKTNS